MSYKLITKDGSAKRGEFTTPHGVIQTPVFMNVGTAAAIKGAVSTEESADDRNAGGIVKHLSFACETRRRGCKETRRFA